MDDQLRSPIGLFSTTLTVTTLIDFFLFPYFIGTSWVTKHKSENPKPRICHVIEDRKSEISPQRARRSRSEVSNLFASALLSLVRNSLLCPFNRIERRGLIKDSLFLLVYLCGAMSWLLFSSSLRFPALHRQSTRDQTFSDPHCGYSKLPPFGLRRSAHPLSQIRTPKCFFVALCLLTPYPLAPCSMLHAPYFFALCSLLLALSASLLALLLPAPSSLLLPYAVRPV